MRMQTWKQEGQQSAMLLVMTATCNDHIMTHNKHISADTGASVCQHYSGAMLSPLPILCGP